MKELDQIVLREGLLASMKKGTFVYQKVILAIQKDRWRLNPL